MSQLLTLLTIIFSTSLAFAEMNCRTECTKFNGECLQLGLRGRASALHLKDILNSAQPPILLPWKSSQCVRELKNQNGVISDSGDDCIEFMDPFPGANADPENGSRTSIVGELEATITQENEVTVRFRKGKAPDFSFFVNGKRHNGGDVEFISQVPDVSGSRSPRLLVQTINTCFSID